jgi:hypothetical protein
VLSCLSISGEQEIRPPLFLIRRCLEAPVRNGTYNDAALSKDHTKVF